MGIVITVNEGPLSLVHIDVLGRSLEPGGITQGIAQVFPDKTRVGAGSKAGSVFRPQHQVVLLARNNIDGIYLVVGRRSILPDFVFVGTVQGADSPGVAHGIGAVQLGVDVKGSQVEGVRRLDPAIVYTVAVALAEFRKELFAQILEHLAVQPTESETETIPEKPRGIHHHFLHRKANGPLKPPLSLGLFGQVLDRSGKALADWARTVMVVDFNPAQDVWVDYRKVSGKSHIQVTHVGNPEPAQVVSHVPRTGTVVVKSTAKIFLARNTRHLAQVFRHVETHARRIFQLVHRNGTNRFPLLRFSAADDGACPQVPQVRRKTHHHVQHIGKVLQFHKDAIITGFLEHQRRITGINRKFETSIGISGPKFLAGPVSHLYIGNRQFRLRIHHHTHNGRRRRGKSVCRKQGQNPEPSKVHKTQCRKNALLFDQNLPNLCHIPNRNTDKVQSRRDGLKTHRMIKRSLFQVTHHVKDKNTDIGTL